MNKKKILYFSLIAVILIFITLEVTIILKAPVFYSYDPFSHNYLTEYLVDSGTQPSYYMNTVPLQPIPYKTIFWTAIAQLHLISGIPLVLLFKFLGVFFLVLSAIFIFLSVNNKYMKMMVVMLFLFSSYLFWRGLITYPENMVIMFISLMIYAVSKENTFLVFLSFLFCIVTHYRSMLIPSIILFYYVVKHLSILKKMMLYMGGVILFSIYFLYSYLSQIPAYLSYHFGDFSKISSLEQNVSRYSAISVNQLFLTVGALIILISIFAILFIIKHNSKMDLFMLPIALVPLILLKGDLFNINIPYYRMYSYFILGLICIICISRLNLNFISWRKLLVFFSFAVIIISIVSVQTVTGAILIKGTHINLSDYLNSQDGEKLIISYTPEMKFLGVKYVLNDDETINKIYSNNQITSVELKNLINDYYNNYTNIYLISNKNNFISDLEKPVMFDSKVYLYRVK